MHAQYVDFDTQDGLRLQGLLFGAQLRDPTCIIHVHGLAGNFYENPFVLDIARAAVNRGRMFLSFNNRGHDYIADLRVADSADSRRIGAAYERFSDCVSDLRAACAFARCRGASRIVLEGHSTGANKVVYALASAAELNPSAVVLISPCDDIGVLLDSRGAAVSEDRDVAREMINRGEGDHLMPPGVFFDYPLSAATYLTDFAPGSALDTFPYRNPTSEFREFSKLSIPILVLFGDNGEYLNDTPDHTFDLLKSKAHPSASVTGIVISGASHVYHNRGVELGAAISAWLDENCL